MRTLLLCLLAVAGAASAEPADPRFEEATALLADAASYERATQLFREVLVGAPEHVEARTWLARVLAWQGRHEESLFEYQALARGEAPPAELDVERAEVLSWAGQYPAAESAFEAVLEREPGNARAARGLARVYLWSGRAALAEEAFERALALEEDAEAGRELARLRARRSWKLAVDADYAGANDGFSRWHSRASGHLDLDLATRLVARAGTVRVRHDRKGAAPPGGSERGSDLAFDGGLGVLHRFDGGAAGRLEFGWRGWVHAPDTALALAELELPAAGGVLTLRAEHGDFLERSASVDAVEAGILDTTLRVATWQPITTPVAVFGWAEASFLSDANQRVSTGASVDWSPWAEYDATLSLGGSYLTYTGGSPLYYDPEVDAGGSLTARASQPLLAGLRFELQANTGLGYARQDGADGTGFTWGVAGGPSWQREDGWWMSLRGRTSRSQRVGTYSAHGVSVNLGRAF